VRAYLVDDEPLAIKRLARLLEETGRIGIAGSSGNPEQALEDLRRVRPEVLFLDIQMPAMTGFDLLEKLDPPQPLVVFTTAHDQYALEAFKVNSIDYLLKPVGASQLSRALDKVERMLRGSEAPGDMHALLKQMRVLLNHRSPEYLVRVPCRSGDRVEFVEVAQVTHFYAKDKLTFASTPQKEYALDLTIAELEGKLPPEKWIRIHRSTLVNMEAVKELRSWFGGKLLIKLRNSEAELEVPRDRAAEVRSRLGG
jgi:two-component system LytT family response regulator